MAVKISIVALTMVVSCAMAIVIYPTPGNGSDDQLQMKLEKLAIKAFETAFALQATEDFKDMRQFYPGVYNSWKLKLDNAQHNLDAAYNDEYAEYSRYISQSEQNSMTSQQY